MPRCPNGSRKNKQGICECKVGWAKYKSTCVPKLTPNSNYTNPTKIIKRCPNGTRKNKNRVCECKDKSKILHKNVCINRESIESNKRNTGSKVSKNKEKIKENKKTKRRKIFEEMKNAEEILIDSPSPVSPVISPPKPSPIPSPKNSPIQSENNQPRINNGLPPIGRYNLTPGRENYSATIIQKAAIKFIMKKLSKICPNVSDCLLIGRYRPYILKWFNHFSLEYCENKVKRIGIDSDNAFILELEFYVNLIVEGKKMQGYTSYAILKSTLFKHSDNLWYEYTIGKHLNQFHTFIPIFLETYNLYRYKSTNDRDLLHKQTSKQFDVHTVTKRNIDELLDPVENSTLLDACIKSDIYAFTSQIIQNNDSLYSLIVDSKIDNYNLASVIFQIYFCLSAMNNTGHSFAHYDLHVGNVLLYKPFGDKYIHYRFHFTQTGEVREFYSKYMLKLIDYGRSCIDKSREFFNELKDPKYRKDCGRDHGRDQGLFMGKALRDGIHINYETFNLSHDLRMLQDLRHINRFKSNDIKPLFNKLVYNVGVQPNYNGFGTVPNNTRGGMSHINNIFDVPDNFWEYIVQHPQHQQNPPQAEIKGILDIYDDMTTPLNLKII